MVRLPVVGVEGEGEEGEGGGQQGEGEHQVGGLWGQMNQEALVQLEGSLPILFQNSRMGMGKRV